MNLTEIPGIGEKTTNALSKIGIDSVSKLLAVYPRTYRTYSYKQIIDAQVGEYVLLVGTVSKVNSHHTGKISTQTATFRDESGSLTLRWFNMPYLNRSLKPGKYTILGKIEIYRGSKQIVSPQIKNNQLAINNYIQPIYRQQGSIKPWVFRQKIQATLDAIKDIPDPLPLSIINKYNLLDYRQALEYLHRPQLESQLKSAIYRLSWQELYQLQIDAQLAKKSNTRIGFPFLNLDYRDFLNHLPFSLTSYQLNAISILSHKLSEKYAMNALLQGEVGSGKTVIAAALAFITAQSGYQTLVMAPTEILANQLFTTFSKLLPNLSVSLITAGSHGNSGAQIVVGTHAILNKKYSKVGLVIVDEQHRFGVEQRESLVRGDYTPHLLMMTATPIPRSLAQTIFSYLDIIRLEGAPPGRLPVKTFYVNEYKRKDSYAWIKSEIGRGSQVFMVTPLIEMAEEEEVSTLKSVKELETSLKQYFPGIAIDVMHGKMGSSQKAARMADFKAGLTKILVATSMIEVGIDVPEANIIVIENAERFGLAQLHQLRGRVGRGGAQGYCLLFSNSQSNKALARLKYFIGHLDGEELARYDLENRGPGELFGLSQSGFFNLTIGSMYDERLLQETSEAVKITGYDTITKKKVEH